MNGQEKTKTLHKCVHSCSSQTLDCGSKSMPARAPSPCESLGEDKHCSEHEGLFEWLPFFYWLLDENDQWKITHTRCWSNTLLTEPHGKGWFLYSYQRLPKKANETDRLALWSKSWRLNDAEAFTVLPQIPVRCKNCWLLTWCKPIFYAILKRNEAQSAHAWVKVVNSWNTEGWGPGAAEVSGGKGGNAPFATEQF